MKRNYLHAYAIVRYDMFHDETVPIDRRITVKKIVFDPEHAQAEVSRLNDLNRGKAHYFAHITRIEQPMTPTEALQRPSGMSGHVEMRDDAAELRQAAPVESGGRPTTDSD